MPDYLATYDLKRAVRDPHSTFKAQAQMLGWSEYIPATDGHSYKLPNTTLRGVFANMQEAQNQFFLAASRTQALGYVINVEKWIIVQFVDVKFNSDEWI